MKQSPQGKARFTTRTRRKTAQRSRNQTTNETTDEHRSVFICVHLWFHFVRFMQTTMREHEQKVFLVFFVSLRGIVAAEVIQE